MIHIKNSMSPFYFQDIAILFVMSVNAAIGFYVFLKSPRRDTASAFFIFTLGLAIWGGGIAVLSLTGFAVLPKIIFLGGTTMVLGLFLLAHTFPERRVSYYLIFWYSAPFLSAYLLSPTSAFIRGAILQPDGVLRSIHGPLFPAYAVVMTAYVLWSLYVFIRTYRQLSGIPKLHMQYLFLGASIFIVSALVFDMFLPMMGVSYFNLLGPLASIFFVGFTAYAILRHQLLDIKIVIQRGLIYTVLLSLVIGFYLSAVSLAGYFFQLRTNIAILLAAGLTTIIGIFGVPIIERHFRRLTDRIFFKDKYDYGLALHELSEILNKSLSVEDIIGRSTEKLKRILRISGAAFAMPQTEFGSDDPNSVGGLELAVILEDKILGTLRLGEKLSGDPYSVEDIRLLKTFVYQLAVALEKASLYEKVRSHSEELEKKVGERTQELKKLYDAQSRFLADISHAFQTPLAILKGNVGLLARPKTQKKNGAKFFLGAMEKTLDRLSLLTNQLLSLSRAEFGARLFQKKPVRLDELLQEIYEDCEILAQDKRIRFSFQNPSGSVSVLGDREALKEAFLNLMSNALKSTSSGGEVTLSLAKEGMTAKVIVQDTGRGISPAELPHIFERFYQGNGQTGEGVGLGLAIAKQTIEAHGGTIEVKSEVGRGTAFIVRLSLEK